MLKLQNFGNQLKIKNKLNLNKYKKFFDKRKKLLLSHIQESKVKQLTSIKVNIEAKSFRKKYGLNRISLQIPGGRLEHYQDKKKINIVIKTLEQTQKIIDNEKFIHLSEIGYILGSRNYDVINNGIESNDIRPLGFIYYKNGIKKTPYFYKEKILTFLKKYFSEIRRERKYDNKLFLDRINDYEKGKKLESFR